MTENLSHKEFEPIKAMFETGKILKMSQLTKLSPTKLSKAVGIKYGRYIEKLLNPALFIIQEVKDLAKIIDVEFDIVMNVILKELKSK